MRVPPFRSPFPFLMLTLRAFPFISFPGALSRLARWWPLPERRARGLSPLLWHGPGAFFSRSVTLRLLGPHELQPSALGPGLPFPDLGRSCCECSNLPPHPVIPLEACVSTSQEGPDPHRSWAPSFLTW